MKTYIKILSILSVCMVLASCAKEKKKTDVDIRGDWHLIEASITDIEYVDIYVSFSDNDSFILYQKLGEGRFVRFEGTYTVSGNIVNGIYQDGTSWACPYKASVESEILTFVAQSSSGEMTKYVKAEIPENVIAEALESKYGFTDSFGERFL